MTEGDKAGWKTSDMTNIISQAIFMAGHRTIIGLHKKIGCDFLSEFNTSLNLHVYTHVQKQINQLTFSAQKEDIVYSF